MLTAKEYTFTKAFEGGVILLALLDTLLCKNIQFNYTDEKRQTFLLNFMILFQTSRKIWYA